MRKRNPSSRRRSSERTVLRREALKGLGALAISLPVLGSAACSSKDTPDGDSMSSGTGGAASGSGGSAPSMSSAGTGGTGSGGASSTGSAGMNSHPAGGTGGTTPATGSGGAGGSTSMASGGKGGSGGSGAGGSGSGGMTGGDEDFVPVTFDEVAMCSLTPTDSAGEGPFFVHEDEVMNDESLFRADMREDRDGVELQLNLRVLDSEMGCNKPISGVEVYVWHTDALGLYSGFDDQNPDQSYMGAFERTVENDARFCRGVQVTNDEGVVSFKTVYPGWYNGRPIHIHFVALRPGSGPATTSYRSSQYMVFTTQMYIAEQFSRMIHEHNAPYMTRASGTGYETYVKPGNSKVLLTTRMEGAIAVAALNVVTAATGSRR